LTLYHQLTGRDLSDFAFYRVLAMFKLGVVFLQLHAQFRRGTVSDQRYARFLPIAEGIIEFADDVALGRAA
jgi:aminoglycoside phosphotransferase (APT) family kinase protein